MSNPLGGCSPISAPDGASIQPLRSMLYELASQLGPEDYRALVVPMVAVLSTTASTALVSYRVPTTHNFVVNSIAGILALREPFNETLAMVNGTDATKGIGDFGDAPNVRDRLALKSMNCEMTLVNADRDMTPIITEGKLNLSTILTLIGGRPLDWSATPHIVNAGETLQANISLVQSASSGDVAKLVGGATTYGMLLSGILVRVARS